MLWDRQEGWAGVWQRGKTAVFKETTKLPGIHLAARLPVGILDASLLAGSTLGCVEHDSQSSHQQHSCLHLEVWPAGAGF